MINVDHLREIIEPIKELEIPFYIHAGFGLHLYGLDSELDDCDIRLYHSNIEEVLPHLQSKVSYKVYMRGAMPYEKGTYENKCIKLNNGLEFDICTKMQLTCDLGAFEFPFNKTLFNNVTITNYKGLELPVASLENLLLYYLVLRRGTADGKSDHLRIKSISEDKRFNFKKFKQIVTQLPQAKQILALYETSINAL